MRAVKFIGEWVERSPEESDIISTCIHGVPACGSCISSKKAQWRARGADQPFDSLEEAKSWWIWYYIPPEEFHNSKGCWVLREKRSGRILCRHETRDAAERCKFRQEILDKHLNVQRKVRVAKLS